jgi:hypothetical protein
MLYFSGHQVHREGSQGALELMNHGFCPCHHEHSHPLAIFLPDLLTAIAQESVWVLLGLVPRSRIPDPSLLSPS